MWGFFESKIRVIYVYIYKKKRLGNTAPKRTWKLKSMSGKQVHCTSFVFMAWRVGVEITSKSHSWNKIKNHVYYVYAHRKVVVIRSYTKVGWQCYTWRMCIIRNNNNIYVPHYNLTTWCHAYTCVTMRTKFVYVKAKAIKVN